MRELESNFEEIYLEQTETFKINAALGLILIHSETGEYRYFIPYHNMTLFPTPLTVSRLSDIEKVKDRLKNFDLGLYFRQQRPDTKWKPFLVTNVVYFVTKTGFNLGKGLLPDYVKAKRCIEGLEHPPNNRSHYYSDSLCAFRCFALHQGQKIKMNQTVNLYYNQWREYMKNEIPQNPKKYEGILLEDLPDFERCFEVSIYVYELQADGTAILCYKPTTKFRSIMYLNVYEYHLSYIYDFKTYAKKYQCPSCERHFNHLSNYKRHLTACSNRTKFKFPGGFFSPNESIFDQLAEFGINVSEDNQTYKWFATFDFESMLEKTDEHPSKKLYWLQKHHPVSVSICSNVPGYEEPVCFINPDLNLLLTEMFDHLNNVQRVTQGLAEEKWGYAITELNDQIKQWAPKDSGSDSDEDNSESEERNSEKEGCQGNKIMYRKLKYLKSKLTEYMNQLPLIGFNSASYDINLIKSKLFSFMNFANDEVGYVIKRNNSYISISNEKYKFLDILQFLAPGSSYSKFLKAFEANESKGFFPYEYFDCIERLNETALPPHECFHSNLKNTNISLEEYEYLQSVWKTENMKTFRDFLVWYNNKDVAPFVIAVTRMQEFYFQRNIDILKISVSVPGIARKMLFETCKRTKTHFQIFGPEDEDLYRTFKANIVGGPSIIFHRHQKVNETLIRGRKPCKKVVGYDACALYLWAIGKDQPSGVYVRRLESNNFKTERQSRYVSMYEWLDWKSAVNGIDIIHKMNSGHEKRIGPYLVDGYCPQNNTVFEVRCINYLSKRLPLSHNEQVLNLIRYSLFPQFQGCYVHGCGCQTGKMDEIERKKRYSRTQHRQAFIEDRGYNVEVIWECAYQRLKWHEPGLRLNNILPPFARKYPGALSQEDILKAVQSEQLFGAVEVDISVSLKFN